MITIYKNKDIKVVTKGAYENFYKSLGYNLMIEQVDENKPVEEEKLQVQLDETVTKPRKGKGSNKKNKKEE